MLSSRFSTANAISLHAACHLGFSNTRRVLYLRTRQHLQINRKVLRRLSPILAAKSNPTRAPPPRTNRTEDLPAALLTRRIADSLTDTALYSLLRSHHATLNPIHLAAATKTLRRLKASKESSLSAQLVVSLMTTDSAPSRLLLACPPRELSSIAWACTQVFPQPGLISSVIGMAAKKVLNTNHSELAPQGLCNLFWAFASWSCSEEEELLSLLSLSLEYRLTTSGSDCLSAQDISMLLWSMARLSYLPSTSIVKNLSLRAMSIMEASKDQPSLISTQGLSNIVWAAGSLSRLCLDPHHNCSTRLNSFKLVVVRASESTLGYNFKLIETSALMSGLTLIIQSIGVDDLYFPALQTSFKDHLVSLSTSLMSRCRTVNESMGPLASITSSLVPLTSAIASEAIEAWVIALLDFLSRAQSVEFAYADATECSTVLWALCRVLSDMRPSISIDTTAAQFVLSRLMNRFMSVDFESSSSKKAIAKVAWSCEMNIYPLHKAPLAHKDPLYLINDNDTLAFLNKALPTLLMDSIDGSTLGLFASVLWALSHRLERIKETLHGSRVKSNPRVLHSNELDEGWGIITSKVNLTTVIHQRGLSRLTRRVLKTVVNKIQEMLLQSDLHDPSNNHQNNVAALSTSCSRLGLKDATLFALISRHVMETSKVRSWSGSVLSSISWAMSNSRCNPSVPLYLLSMVSDNRPPFVDDVSAMSACKLLCGIARLRTRVYRKQALVDTLAGKIKSYLLIASTSSLRPYLKSSQIVDIIYSLATLRHCDITLWDLLCSILTLPISSTQERLINSLDIHGLIIMLWSTSVIGADLLSPIGLPVRRLMNSLESLDLKESILLLWSLSRQPLVLSRIRSMRNIFYCLVIGVLENILTLLDGQGLTIKSTISLHESLYVLGSLKVPHELRLKIGKLSSQSCNRMRATSNQDPTLSQVLITLRSMRIVSREFHIRSFSYPSLRTTRRFIHVEAPCGLDIVLMLVHNYEFSANVHGSRTKRRRELLGSTFIELQASQSYLGKHKRLIIFNSDDFKKLKLRYQRQQYLNMILKL